MSERLEEIQSRVWKDKGTYAMGDNESREGYIYTLSDYDFEWLIKQAERVEELEEENKRLAAFISSKEQNCIMCGDYFIADFNSEEELYYCKDCRGEFE